ncbi:hypothetical protein B0H13DRAFT_2326831 [Mycena leptocephala]|nr:hypothetical protein B0H13DRAFT_2326831 [Mycena leptocephala]
MSDAVTADLVPAAESDSQSTAVLKIAWWTTHRPWPGNSSGTSESGSIAAPPSSNSTGVMAPQDRAGDDEDSDEPDKGKARQVIPDLYETPPTPSLDSPALVQGANPFLLTVPLPWWVLCNEESSDNLPSTSGWAGVQDRTTTSMGLGTRATPARSTMKTRQGANGVERSLERASGPERTKKGRRRDKENVPPSAESQAVTTAPSRRKPLPLVNFVQPQDRRSRPRPVARAPIRPPLQTLPQPASHVLSQSVRFPPLDLFSLLYNGLSARMLACSRRPDIESLRLYYRMAIVPDCLLDMDRDTGLRFAPA